MQKSHTVHRITRQPARSLAVLLPVFQRRKTGMTLEDLRKIGKIAVSGFQRHQADRNIRLRQHTPGLFHLLPDDKLGQCDTRLLFKQAGKIFRV